MDMMLYLVNLYLQYNLQNNKIIQNILDSIQKWGTWGYNIIFFICMGNIHLSVVHSHIWAKDYKINYIKTFVTQKWLDPDTERLVAKAKYPAIYK